MAMTVRPGRGRRARRRVAAATLAGILAVAAGTGAGSTVASADPGSGPREHTTHGGPARLPRGDRPEIDVLIGKRLISSSGQSFTFGRLPVREPVGFRGFTWVDGRLMALGGTDREGGYRLYTIAGSPGRPRVSRVVRSTRGSPSLSPDGNQVAWVTSPRYELGDRAPRRLHVQRTDGRGEPRTELFGVEDETLHVAGYMPNGRVVVSGDVTEGRVYVAATNLRGGRHSIPGLSSASAVSADGLVAGVSARSLEISVVDPGRESGHSRTLWTYRPALVLGFSPGGRLLLTEERGYVVVHSARTGRVVDVITELGRASAGRPVWVDEHTFLVPLDARGSRQVGVARVDLRGRTELALPWRRARAGVTPVLESIPQS